MGSSVFSIGLSGIKAANLGLTTAGHNIANVNTDGYSRQAIKQSAPYPDLSGNGYVGLGVKVDTIERSYDQFLTRQVQTTQAKTSYYSSYLSHLQGIDNLVGDSSAGVSPAMEDYFSAVQNVATNPSNLPARQSFLSSAQVMVNRFQSVNQQLVDQRASVNGEISNAVANINAYAKQIADINQKIVLNSGTGQAPNDLLDQRDQLVKDLNSMVKASTIEQSDGSINVFIGSGQNLVVGSQTFALAAVPSPADPQNVTIVYKQNDNTVYLSESSLAGGQLGGLLDFRANALNVAENSLAQVALGMTQMLNAQQRAGMDLNGNLGQNLFDFARSSHATVTLPGTQINISASGDAIPASDFNLEFDGAAYTLTRLSDNSSQSITAADMLAGFKTNLGVTLSSSAAATAAGSASWSFPPDIGYISPNAQNAGDASLSGYISDVGQLSASNYELVFDGSNYILTRQSDNAKTVSATMPLEVDGLSLKIDSGSMVAGDRFTIQPTRGFIESLAVRITNPSEVAAASPIKLTSGASYTGSPTALVLSSGNTGSASLTQPLVDAPSTSTTVAATNPALKNPVNITFTSGSSFDVTDTVTGVTTTQTYTAGMTLSVNGWSLKITGQPASGDTFAIGDNVGGSEDGSNALSLAALQTSKLLSNGTATFGQKYSQMVASIGTQTSEASIMAEAQSTMLTQAETARDSVSGVNLDEEAASLLRYQQAYIAASKLIQIAQQAFEEIANIAG